MQVKTIEVQPYEHEPASNAYLMSIIGIISGVPLPIVNTIASLLYFLAQRKNTYYVRWHSLQALLAQVMLMPFNSIALAWTLRIIFSKVQSGPDFIDQPEYYTELKSQLTFLNEATVGYWAYICFIVFINLFEFIAIIVTATEVRKGKNIRFFGIARLTDLLCSKENKIQQFK
ncbi:DUF4870 domain-containing protein [Flavobacterium sp. RNTU_13]|jgi:uncharacterized membrane protein|uniref:DUF4870 domain-containing protein n=1 Tax=Flavobacterium sp. RNTU_13 TaxID=3375145 RepID=UPI003986A297